MCWCRVGRLGVLLRVWVRLSWLCRCMVCVLVVSLVGRVLSLVCVLVMLFICISVSVRLSFSLFWFGLVVIVCCRWFIVFLGDLIVLVIVFLVVGVFFSGCMWCDRNLCSWFSGSVLVKLLRICLFFISIMVGIEWMLNIVVSCWCVFILILLSWNVLLYLVVSCLSSGFSVLYGLY